MLVNLHGIASVKFCLFVIFIDMVYHIYYEKGFSEHCHHGNLSLRLTLKQDSLREVSHHLRLSVIL